MLQKRSIIILFLVYLFTFLSVNIAAISLVRPKIGSYRIEAVAQIPGDFKSVVASDVLVYAANNTRLLIYKREGSFLSLQSYIELNSTIERMLIFSRNSAKFIIAAAGSAGFFIINVTSNLPRIVFRINVSDYATSAEIFSSYYLITSDKRCLRIYDISDLTTPMLLNESSIENIVSIRAKVSYFYVSNFTHIMIYKPEKSQSTIRLKLENIIKGDDYIYDITFAEDYALFAESYAGVVKMDVTNPTSPKLVGTYDTEGVAIRVYYDSISGICYVCDGVNGIKVFSLDSLLTIGYYDTSVFARDVAVSDYIYVADDSGGLLILKMSEYGIGIPTIALFHLDILLVLAIVIAVTAGYSYYLSKVKPSIEKL